MNKTVKYIAVFAAGYFIGFYEYKYKVTKAVALNYVNKDVEGSKKEEESK